MIMAISFEEIVIRCDHCKSYRVIGNADNTNQLVYVSFKEGEKAYEGILGEIEPASSCMCAIDENPLFMVTPSTDGDLYASIKEEILMGVESFLKKFRILPMNLGSLLIPCLPPEAIAKN